MLELYDFEPYRLYIPYEKAGELCDKLAENILQKADEDDSLNYRTTKEAVDGIKAETDPREKIRKSRRLTYAIPCGVEPYYHHDSWGNAVYFRAYSGKVVVDQIYPMVRAIAEYANPNAAIHLCREGRCVKAILFDGKGRFQLTDSITVPEGKANSGKRGYSDIRRILNSLGLLDGSDPSTAMIVCSCFNAIEAKSLREDLIPCFDAVCRTVEEFWVDNEENVDLGKISDLVAEYYDIEGELPDAQKWPEFREWAGGRGLI